MGMRKKQEIKKQVKEMMLNIYYSPENKISNKCVDWMGYPINNFDDLTYHHITKASTLRNRSKDDKATLQNGALLCDSSHQNLHILEQIEPELYDLWNNLFIIINKSRNYPDEDTLNMILALQKATEKKLNEFNQKRHI